MFCPNCGNSLDDHAKFCPRCGAQIGTAEEKKREQASPSGKGDEKMAAAREKMEAFRAYVTDKKNRKKVIAGSVILVIVLFFGLLGGSLDKDVRIVKTGHFYAAQNITVGDAFDKFFANTKWKSSVSGNTHYVYFEGDAGNTQGKGYKKFRATFVVYPDQGTFNMTRTEIDGHDVTGSQSTFIPQICAGASQISYTYQQ